VSKVVSGLERWLGSGRRESPVADGAGIGLVVHAASVDASAVHAIRRVADGGRFRIRRLFAPEHGLCGHEQDMERVADHRDPASGVPVVSLYGATAESLRPSPADLRDLDAIVYDLQDVGSRYYTFVSTLSFLMEAARDAGVSVVVLDRPNPIGGVQVEGPVLQPGLASFVGRYALPVRHGMTAGELARMFNEAFGIGCDLRVVELGGWRRSMSFDDTGLPWVPPSPNMPSPRTALVYPGGCLVEGTNLSEGRGTTTPFEQVGAPWLDGGALAAALGREALEGVLFRSASFRPMFHKHAGRGCSGVQVIATDAARFRPFDTYLALLREARRLAPESFAWRAEAYEFETERLAIDLLLGRSDLRPAIEAGATLAEMRATWRADLEGFRELRRRFLLYED
jgi:uncharacterized protein YbbC (DUF1343 family)